MFIYTLCVTFVLMNTYFCSFYNNILGENKLFITDYSCLILFLNFLPIKILKSLVLQGTA